MRQPFEFADAAREAQAKSHQEDDLTEYDFLIRRLEILSSQFSTLAVELGEQMHKDVAAGRLEPEYVRDVLDKLYDQRSYQ